MPQKHRQQWTLPRAEESLRETSTRHRAIHKQQRSVAELSLRGEVYPSIECEFPAKHVGSRSVASTVWLGRQSLPSNLGEIARLLSSPDFLRRLPIFPCRL